MYEISHKYNLKEINHETKCTTSLHSQSWSLLLDEEVIDSLTVKIILAEGAKNIQVVSSYEIS